MFTLTNDWKIYTGQSMCFQFIFVYLFFPPRVTFVWTGGRAFWLSRSQVVIAFSGIDRTHPAAGIDFTTFIPLFDKWIGPRSPSFSETQHDILETSLYNCLNHWPTDPSTWKGRELIQPQSLYDLHCVYTSYKMGLLYIIYLHEISNINLEVGK